MSCNCDNDEPIPTESVENESLPSELDNFVLNFFGSVTKVQTEEDRVEWALPCGLDQGLADYRKLEGEGISCYFLRLFQDSIVGLTGDKGEKGDPGANGADGRTTVAEAFTVPPTSAPVVNIKVANGAVLPDNVNIFVESAGWFSVASHSGNTLSCQLLTAIALEGSYVPVGSLVIPVGPEGAVGPAGGKGSRGDRGEDGDAGAPGAAGEDGGDANTRTTASYVQPAVNSTVPVPVADGGPVSGGAEVLLGGVGYYQIAASSPGLLTLRNRGGVTPAPTTVVADDKTVLLSGLPGPLAKEVVGVGVGTSVPVGETDWYTVGFDETDLRITLPAAGTYRVVVHLEMRLYIFSVEGNKMNNGIRLVEADTDPEVVLGAPSYFYAGGSSAGFRDDPPTGRYWSHGSLVQQVSVPGPRTLAVQYLQSQGAAGLPAGYESYPVSGLCWVSWMKVNDTY
jgi:hypothetical protein